MERHHFQAAAKLTVAGIITGSLLWAPAQAVAATTSATMLVYKPN